MSSRQESARRAVMDCVIISNASRSQIYLDTSGIVRIKLIAPPIDGRANRCLIEFLTEQLNLKRSQITILAGLRSRRKRIAISGISADELKHRLTQLTTADARH